MSYFSRSRGWAWLAAGLILGWLISSFWPSTPLHAVATDRAENITIATGLVDNEVEAVFFLDAQTGMLRAGIPSVRQPGTFQSVWVANLTGDLGTVVGQVNTRIRNQNATRKAGATLPEIQIPQTPKFLMVTGLLDMRQTPVLARPGRSLVYVAEANTGVILAYALPWNPNFHVANKPWRQQMVLWSYDKLATAIVPGEE